MKMLRQVKWCLWTVTRTVLDVVASSMNCTGIYPEDVKNTKNIMQNSRCLEIWSGHCRFISTPTCWILRPAVKQCPQFVIKLTLKTNNLFVTCCFHFLLAIFVLLSSCSSSGGCGLLQSVPLCIARIVSYRRSVSLTSGRICYTGDLELAARLNQVRYAMKVQRKAMARSRNYFSYENSTICPFCIVFAYV